MPVLLGRLDRRRHELFDWRLQLRRHRGTLLSILAGALALTAGFAALSALRQRRAERALTRGRKLRRAVARSIHDPERVAAVIHEIRPDAIALQEVNSRAGIERGIDQVDFLARATAMYPIAGPALRDHRGECGNAILTRFPVLATRRLDVSVPGREPRGLLDVMLDAHGRTLRLVSTHLGLAWRERRKQVALLVELMRADNVWDGTYGQAS